ncbi:hypothetical protein ABIE20_005327, partial [Pseudomonas sp. 2835]
MVDPIGIAHTNYLNKPTLLEEPDSAFPISANHATPARYPMPTENRSSNTEQMVSVPRDLAEDICNGLRITQERGIKELRALLAQPAAQHQGEPMKPYGYLREVDGRCQLSVGPER